MLVAAALTVTGCPGTPKKPPIPAGVYQEIQALKPPLTLGQGWYSIQRGDTFYRIAQTYHTTVAELMRLNPSITTSALAVGTVIRVPSGEQAPPKTPEPPANPVAPKIIANLTVSPQGYVWPVAGTVAVRFGDVLPGEPAMRCRGIDIAADAGAEIRASRAGKAYVVRSSLPQFGNAIAIDHGGVTTFYGYDLVVRVQNGDSVQQGQVIALAPSGGSASVRVHFRIERDGRPINPLSCLPMAR